MREKIVKFFQERPAISVRSVEAIAKMPSSSLYKFIIGQRGLPEKHLESLVKVITIYGFKPK